VSFSYMIWLISHISHFYEISLIMSYPIVPTCVFITILHSNFTIYIYESWKWTTKFMVV